MNVQRTASPALVDKTASDWIELEARTFLRVTRRLPVVLVRGEGSRVWDTEGRSYLDMLGGFAANTLGHGHPVVKRALVEQAESLIHTSNQFYTIPQLDLADLLIAHSPFDRVFFVNSGAEANEAVIKLVRKWGTHQRHGAYEVITTDGSFHGRTLATLAATGKPALKQDYGPLPPGFVTVPFNDLQAIKQATGPETCAILLEHVQADGGVLLADPDYLHGVRCWCDEQGLALIFDEVQTGVGRLGTLWGFERFGVEPDLMTLAKGLGGGVPIGAVLTKERFSVFAYGDHGSTFGGNPLVSAVALAVMREVLDRDLPAHAGRVGAYFRARLERLRLGRPYITDVRGHGLLLGLEFSEALGRSVVLEAVTHGLLLNSPEPCVLRFAPALTLTEEEVDEVITILQPVIDRVAAAQGLSEKETRNR